jgi:hypothetical protein
VKPILHRLPRYDGILFFAAWGGFLCYVWPRLFYATPDGIFAGERAIWGDWAGHLAGTAVFAFRPVSLWFQNHPLFYGQTFNYPFVSSMISGLLMRAGMGRVPAMVIPSLITSLLLLGVLYFFYRNILKSQRQAYLAITLFFMSGGLGFFYYIADSCQAGSIDAWLFPIREYTFLEDKGIHFRNIFPAELFPQRSFLLGLTAALLLLMILMQWLSDSSDRISPLKFFSLGLPAGLLMIVHTHTYMAVVLLCLCLAVCNNLISMKRMVAFALGAAMVSLFLYISLHGQSRPSRWFGLEWGWMSNNQRSGVLSFLKFWLMNWGLILPLALAGTIWMRDYRHPLVIAGWLLFVLCNIIRFQPWNWDNTKLLTWSYLLLLIPVVRVLSGLWRTKRCLLRVGVVTMIGVLVFSGGLELMRLLQTSRTTHKMWEPSKIDMAIKLQKIITPEETVLTDDDHLNWVACLAGGQILMGFRGWLWSYGIDYHERENEVRAMYSGKPEAESLFEKYHVRYAVLSPSARTNLGGNEFFFMSKYRLVMRDGDTRVYDVRSYR